MSESLVTNLSKSALLIILDSTGHVLKVTDLGLARARGFLEPFSKQTGGTSLYLAPECWEGKERSEKSDVYAAGVIGYEMLTGKFVVAFVDWLQHVESFDNRCGSEIEVVDELSGSDFITCSERFDFD